MVRRLKAPPVGWASSPPGEPAVVVLGVAMAGGEDGSLDLVGGSSTATVLGVATTGDDSSLCPTEPPSAVAVVGVAGLGVEA